MATRPEARDTQQQTQPQSTRSVEFVHFEFGSFRVRFIQVSVNQAVSVRHGSHKRAVACARATVGTATAEYTTLPDLARAVPASGADMRTCHGRHEGSCKEKFRFEWLESRYQ